MIIKSATFHKSASNNKQCPDDTDLPEICFIGRSNVGKSSLINTLVNQKRLVKKSSTPGCTKLINFFLINNEFYFVDLPGYGYAKVPKTVKKKLGNILENYLIKRENLSGIITILDIRRIPDEKEINLINWVNDLGLPQILIITKADKLSKIKQKNQFIKIANTLSVDPKNLILFSAKNRLGKDILLEKIEELLEKNKLWIKT